MTKNQRIALHDAYFLYNDATVNHPDRIAMYGTTLSFLVKSMEDDGHPLYLAPGEETIHRVEQLLYEGK